MGLVTDTIETGKRIKESAMESILSKNTSWEVKVYRGEKFGTYLERNFRCHKFRLIVTDHNLFCKRYWEWHIITHLGCTGKDFIEDAVESVLFNMNNEHFDAFVSRKENAQKNKDMWKAIRKRVKEHNIRMYEDF